MIFVETGIPGAYLVDPEPILDERGSFARTFCARAFAERGLAAVFVQCNASFSVREGTLRGLHYQRAPHEEAKLVRCTRGATYHVVVDLRPSSPAYRTWRAVHLRAAEGRMLYVPEGVANGFQTLEDATEVFYQMSAPYHPELAAGVRWDDPALAIDWPPTAHRILSARDATLPDFLG